MVDSDTVVHPDTPNFFEMIDRKYTGVLDLGCWEWTGRSLRHYKDMFDGYKLDIEGLPTVDFRLLMKTIVSFLTMYLTLL